MKSIANITEALWLWLFPGALFPAKFPLPTPHHSCDTKHTKKARARLAVSVLSFVRFAHSPTSQLKTRYMHARLSLCSFHSSALFATAFCRGKT